MVPTALKEIKKRKKELWVITGLLFLFLILTGAEFRILKISEELPFVDSVFFFGLVNFNIIVFLLLMFLIFRNVVKVFAEKPGRILGKTLKGKLIAAFVGFSFIPTLLMFLVSVFYINNSFEKWFSIKVAGVLKSSLDVTNAYYVSAKKKNYHFAHLIAEQITRSKARSGKAIQIRAEMEKALRRYNLDCVEFYPGLFEPRLMVLSSDQSIPEVPAVNIEFLEKALVQRAETTTIHSFGEGNLVRVIVPGGGKNRGAFVVSTYVPLSLITKVAEISAAYDDFRDLNPLEYPVKSIYLIILVLMTLTILFGATWFGFYLAKQLSTSLEQVGQATKRVARGDFRKIDFQSGSAEVNQLIESFNLMTRALRESESKVLEANRNLKIALEALDEHTRYIEVVVSHVNTGVVSIDADNRITMINRRAAELLRVDPNDYTGRRLDEVLDRKHWKMAEEIISNMRAHGSQLLQKEISVDINSESVPFQVALSLLIDDGGRELGKVVVFDDLTMLMNMQRAAAWKEVARRIAHEIKNPLTPIKLSAERLRKKFGATIQDPAFLESTTVIIKQVDELKNMVNEFSHFARLPQIKTVFADYNRVIEEGIVLFRDAHKQVVFETDFDPNLPYFHFDPEQIRRVVNNLLDNALSALQNQAHGKIIARTEYDAQLKIARLWIIDNGPGIPGYLRNRLFEPYVTTKHEGSGLGLSIVKRIVEDHNGFIRVFASEPQGTAIKMEFPVIEATRAASEAAGPAR